MRKDAAGFLVAPANLTRTGVFLYDGPNNSTIRELRLPEEVFHADSLATLRSAPLTDEQHRTVTVENWRDVAIGHVDGEARQDGQYVAAAVKVTDKGTIGRVDSKELGELSCGYKCDIEETSGEWEGQHYDSIQRNIRYNHVALGPVADWGRAGAAVRLRMDGGMNGAGYLHGYYSDLQAQTRADSKEHDPMTPEEKARFDALESELATLKKSPALAPVDPRVDALSGKISGLEANVSTLTAELTQARDPKRLDALVSARTALVTTASKIVGSEFKADGKTDADIVKECVLKLDPSAKLDGKTAEYIAAAFDVLSKREDAVKSARSDVARSVPTTVTADGGQTDEQRADALEKAAEYKTTNAWRGAEWLKANPFKK